MGNLNILTDEICKLKEFQLGVKKLKDKKGPLHLTGLSTVQKASIIYTMCSKEKRTALVITADEIEAQNLCSDLQAFGGKALFYPAKEINFADMEGKSKEYEHERLKVLSRIEQKEIDIVVTTIDATLQYTIPQSILKRQSYFLSVSQTIEISSLEEQLTKSGYEKYEKVEGIGQFSRRGFIVDVFVPNSNEPIRIEFWGNQIDSINNFDIITQRRTDRLENIFISPVSEALIQDKKDLIFKFQKLIDQLPNKATNEKVIARLKKELQSIKESTKVSCNDKFLPILYPEPATLLDYIDHNSFIVESEPINIKQRLASVKSYTNEMIKNYIKDGILCKGLDTIIGNIDNFYSRRSLDRTIYLETFVRYESHKETPISINTNQISPWNGDLKLLYEDITPFLSKNYKGIILVGSEKAAKMLVQDLQKGGIRVSYQKNISELSKGGVVVTKGSLSSGFCYESIKIFVISHTCFSKKKKKKSNIKNLFNLEELNPGDYVVHNINGIGIFCGIHNIESEGVKKDYIKIKYAKGDILYVPVTQLDIISKYIGAGENSVIRLNKLGTSEWAKSKAQVKKVAKNIAKDLIKLYSKRMTAKGYAFSEDTELHRDFEARFEYEETDDQLRCINEIKDDMEKIQPMDRLLCGDVGFGKTEVALRAAFKCIMDSKQCAMLVPTTILAWQHYQNILKRFQTFPVKIELLSRFRTPKQQHDIIKRLKRGEIDFVIGTHRLVQKDVAFHDLGLIIIDEEQRFGVAHKEKFKKLKENVDVLTLSATPIPRTLNMAMTGIRDMSSLEEAPQDRHPVQTYVLEYNETVIQEAIKKELRRNGQVYYVYNRVESIEGIALKLKRLLPEARIRVAHGKMDENEISEVWRAMLEHNIDVLVCTTIIETGIDVSNVNTIIITNADHLGLSQLHQLRGRVGRSSRRAFAYLTFRKNKILTEISEKKLNAIRDFTEFGAGFKIAMRDLELRGAGNLLGGQQHGHMEAVGYDMYLKILSDAVSEEKGEAKTETTPIDCNIDIAVSAHIPEKYIRDINQRLNIYRRISDIRTDEDVFDVIDELTDRFGDIPKKVNDLIDIALIRSYATKRRIQEIKQINNNVFLYQNKLDMDLVKGILSKKNNNAMVNAEKKPYISIQVQKQSKILEDLKNILDIKI